MRKQIKLSLEEWDNILNPIWYRVYPYQNVYMRTTSYELASSFDKHVETLGRIEKIDIKNII